VGHDEEQEEDSGRKLTFTKVSADNLKRDRVNWMGSKQWDGG